MLPSDIRDREFKKFKEDPDGDVAVNVVLDSDVEISITPPTGINGGPVTVGTSAVEMTFTGTTLAISLKSKSTNTGTIWFGPSTVDNTGANAYGELTADSAVEIELDDTSTPIYCVSDTADQVVYKAGLT